MQRIILICAPMILLVGCTEYMSRKDRISWSAGDAIAANKAIHVNDPWPREGFDTNSKTIGQRVVVPLQRYRSGLPPQRLNASPATTSASGAASAGQQSLNVITNN